MTDETQHQKEVAVKLFNSTWDLLDKENRTKEEDDRMVHTVHASRFHWGEVVAANAPDTGPMNIERGEWQISRVYSVLKRHEPALYHAQRCMEICKENDIVDFDIAFAYEAMARAHSIGGNNAEYSQFLDLAKEAGEKIKEKGDRDYFFSDLKTVPKP